MISPDFRQCQPIDLATPCKTFVEKAHGHELW